MRLCLADDETVRMFMDQMGDRDANDPVPTWEDQIDLISDTEVDSILANERTEIRDEKARMFRGFRLVGPEPDVVWERIRTFVVCERFSVQSLRLCATWFIGEPTSPHPRSSPTKVDVRDIPAFSRVLYSKDAAIVRIRAAILSFLQSVGIFVDQEKGRFVFAPLYDFESKMSALNRYRVLLCLACLQLVAKEPKGAVKASEGPLDPYSVFPPVRFPFGSFFALLARRTLLMGMLHMCFDHARRGRSRASRMFPFSTISTEIEVGHRDPNTGPYEDTGYRRGIQVSSAVFNKSCLSTIYGENQKEKGMGYISTSMILPRLAVSPVGIARRRPRWDDAFLSMFCLVQWSHAVMLCAGIEPLECLKEDAEEYASAIIYDDTDKFTCPLCHKVSDCGAPSVTIEGRTVPKIWASIFRAAERSVLEDFTKPNGVPQARWEEVIRGFRITTKRFVTHCLLSGDCVQEAFGCVSVAGRGGEPTMVGSAFIQYGFGGLPAHSENADLNPGETLWK